MSTDENIPAQFEIASPEFGPPSVKLNGQDIGQHIPAEDDAVVVRVVAPAGREAHFVVELKLRADVTFNGQALIATTD